LNRIIDNHLTATEIIESDRKKDPINQNDTEVCSICFEEWTNSGQHRLVSTPCGHLFGKM
jgi:hypothetical protein